MDSISVSEGTQARFYAFSNSNSHVGDIFMLMHRYVGDLMIAND